MVDFTDPATVGYSLIALGVVMFLVEAMMPGFFIAVPGSILVILGVAAFYVPFDRFLALAPLVVILAGVPATAITIWTYKRLAPPEAAPTTRSADNLVGLEGKVTRTIDPDSMKGKVKLGRENWSATTDAAVIPEGLRVRVKRVDGVVLIVEPVEPVAETAAE